MLAVAPSGLLLRSDERGELVAVPIQDPRTATLSRGELFVGSQGRRRSRAMRLETFAEYLSNVLPRELARSAALTGANAWSGDELAMAFWKAMHATSEATPSAVSDDHRFIQSEASFDFEPRELLPSELDLPLQLMREADGDAFLLWHDGRALLHLNGRMSVAFEGVPSAKQQLEKIATRGKRRERILDVLGVLFLADHERPTREEIAALRTLATAFGDPLVADVGPYERVLFLRWNGTTDTWDLGAKTPAFAQKADDEHYVLWPESTVYASFAAGSEYSPRRSWLEHILVGDGLRHHPFTSPGYSTLCVEDTLARTHALDASCGVGAQLCRELMAARDVVVRGYGETVRPHQPLAWSIAQGRVLAVSRDEAIAWANARRAELIEW
jgi:hypothetical protein